MARILVIGNEKGGSGKSTVALHLAVSMLLAGQRVGTIDLDARQATLSRYIENRLRQVAKGLDLQVPEHVAILPDAPEADLVAAVERLGQSCRIIFIDTPGSDTLLSRSAHAMADLLVTPMNDSLIDLDVLARIDPEKMRVQNASRYAEMVWDARKRRALGGAHSFDWFVLRNRLSHLDARNKREMARLLAELSKRIGFKLLDGLGERVIYRELFLEGLTLLDLGSKTGRPLSMSQVAARQELRHLVTSLGLLPPEPGANPRE